MKHRLLFTLIASLFLVTVVAMGQQSAQPQAPSQPTDFDKMVETVRADARADKVDIINETMNLKPADSDKFWPVYRRYEAEVIKLNDERISIIKDYGTQFESLTNEQAKALVERMFSWENRRTQLRKTYFGEFAEATSPVIAATFFQVEHRLDLLIDLLVAAEVPGLFERTPAAAKP